MQHLLVLMVVGLAVERVVAVDLVQLVVDSLVQQVAGAEALTVTLQ